MSFGVKVGSFNIGLGAAGTTVAVTTGSTPKAIIFWWTGRTESVDTAGAASVRRGMGFAVSNTSFRATATYDADGAGSTQAAMAHRTDACILECEDVGGTTPTMLGWADIQSMDATGFTLEILDQFTTNLRVHYIALSGDEVDGEIITVTPAGTAPVAQFVATTNVPKAIFFMGVRTATATTMTQGGARNNFSFCAAGNSYQWSGGGGDASGTGANLSYSKMGEVLDSIGSNNSAGAATGMDNIASLTSFDTAPNGFTVTWSKRLQPHVSFALVLSGTFRVAVGSLATGTVTGTLTASGLSFQPTAAMFASSGMAESVSATTVAHERLSLGATDGTTQLQQNHVGRYGNTTMFLNTGITFDSVYQNILETNDVASGGVQGEATFTAFTSDGFTLNQTDADPVAALLAYIAFAPAPSSGYTLTAQEGAMAITGTDAGVVYSKTLTAQSGAIGISGVNANLNRALPLVASPGVVDITGVNANLFSGKTLTAQPGTVDIIGASADLFWKRLVGAQSGAVPIVGIDANLMKSGAVLTAQAGAIPITGVDTSFLLYRALTALSDGVPLSGVDADLLWTHILDAVESGVSILGLPVDFNIAVLNQYELTALGDIVPIAGEDAILRRSLTLTAQAGAVPITGTNAVVRKTWRLVAQPGAVPFTAPLALLIGVEPGTHSTDLITIDLNELRHHIGI